MGTRTAMVIGTIAVFAVLAGCTTSANGTPTAGTQSTQPKTSDTEPSSSPPNSEDETYGAPQVANPLDASRFLTDPCATLTPAQQADLGITRTGEPDVESPSGPGCLWLGGQDTGAVNVDFLTANENGLSDTYRGRDRFSYFEETTIAGYPAVHSDLSDGRPTGRCALVVGITDTLTFLVGEQGQLDAKGACDRTEQVAAAVITTLQGGS